CGRRPFDLSPSQRNGGGVDIGPAAVRREVECRSHDSQVRAAGGMNLHRLAGPWCERNYGVVVSELRSQGSEASGDFRHGEIAGSSCNLVGHPFTAPAARPDTNQRWKMRNSKAMGIAATIAPAAKSFQFCPNWLLMKPRRPTATVYLDGSEIKKLVRM